MDFTYIFALVFAFVMGLVAQAVRLISRRPWTRLNGTIALLAALTANGLLLLNWSHLLDWGVAFAALDLGIMTVLGFAIIAPGAVRALVKN